MRLWTARAFFAIACASPLILWHLIFPPPIDVTAYSQSVVYDFRDAEYAQEFAALNDASIE
jgi:hypothetical protein